MLFTYFQVFRAGTVQFIILWLDTVLRVVLEVHHATVKLGSIPSTLNMKITGDHQRGNST